MGVEFAVVFKEQVENLLLVVVDQRDGGVSVGDGPVGESLGSDEEALQDVDDLDLEFGVGNAFVDGDEDVEGVSLLFVVNVVDLGSQDPEQDHKKRPLSGVGFKDFLLVVLLGEGQSLSFDQVDINLQIFVHHFGESPLSQGRWLIDPAVVVVFVGFEPLLEHFLLPGCGLLDIVQVRLDQPMIQVKHNLQERYHDLYLDLFGHLLPHPCLHPIRSPSVVAG